MKINYDEIEAFYNEHPELIVKIKDLMKSPEYQEIYDRKFKNPIKEFSEFSKRMTKDEEFENEIESFFLEDQGVSSYEEYVELSFFNSLYASGKFNQEGEELEFINDFLELPNDDEEKKQAIEEMIADFAEPIGRLYVSETMDYINERNGMIVEFIPPEDQEL